MRDGENMGNAANKERISDGSPPPCSQVKPTLYAIVGGDSDVIGHCCKYRTSKE